VCGHGLPVRFHGLQGTGTSSGPPVSLCVDARRLASALPMISCACGTPSDWMPLSSRSFSRISAALPWPSDRERSRCGAAGDHAVEDLLLDLGDVVDTPDLDVDQLDAELGTMGRDISRMARVILFRPIAYLADRLRRARSDAASSSGLLERAVGAAHHLDQVVVGDARWRVAGRRCRRGAGLALRSSRRAGRTGGGPSRASACRCPPRCTSCPWSGSGWGPPVHSSQRSRTVDALSKRHLTCRPGSVRGAPTGLAELGMMACSVSSSVKSDEGEPCRTRKTRARPSVSSLWLLLESGRVQSGSSPSSTSR